jgi:hypothetical protein
MSGPICKIAEGENRLVELRGLEPLTPCLQIRGAAVVKDVDAGQQVVNGRWWSATWFGGCCTVLLHELDN